MPYHGKEGKETDEERLKEHAKQHKGGMRSKHMRNMVKFMKEGDSFAKAHKKAMAEDKKGKEYSRRPRVLLRKEHYVRH